MTGIEDSVCWVALEGDKVMELKRDCWRNKVALVPGLWNLESEINFLEKLDPRRYEARME